jgi:Arc/MetJ-type ribon-helix-helix transcriptional regulator
MPEHTESLAPRSASPIVTLRLPDAMLRRIDAAVASGESVTRSEEIRRLIIAGLRGEGRDE